MRRAAAGAAMLLAGCAVATDASPPAAPDPWAASPWAIERQVARCRATQSGGTRSTEARAGGLFLFGTVGAVSRTDTPQSCAAVLALTDEDVSEIRTLAQATAASARGLDTNWLSAAGARREIVLSVYPEAGSRACRIVAADLTVYGDPIAGLIGAPPVTTLDEQRFCRNTAGAWEPA